jgi:hypothetical protein
MGFAEYQRRLAAATRRACCPACHRRGRQVTVGFLVQNHGLYALTRRPRGIMDYEADTDSLAMLYWQTTAGAAYLTDETFRPPIWPESLRMPPELERVNERTIRCRYGHELRVPGHDDLDRMLARVRGHDVIYLPAARV